MLILAVQVTLAGSGPWVLGPGDTQLYLGGEVQRLENLGVVLDAQGNTDVVPVDEGISAVGLKGIGTLGVLPRFELEVTVPYTLAYANRNDGEVCATLGTGSCGTTRGVGVIEVKGEALVLDEVFGSPLSLSVAGVGRAGALTAPTRARVTNIGEGTSDLGAALALGRTGGLANGYWSAFAEGQWLYRFPNTRSYPGLGGEAVAPSPEWMATAQLLVAPDRRYGFGPEVVYFTRQGLDWYQLDLADPDRFAALGVSNLRVGAKAFVRDERRFTLSAGFLYTVYARNNPVDALVVNVGISANRVLADP